MRGGGEVEQDVGLRVYDKGGVGRTRAGPVDEDSFHCGSPTQLGWSAHRQIAEVSMEQINYLLDHHT